MSAQLLQHAVEAGRARDASLSRETRRAHGVVHTPAELARWAMNQVDARLRSHLGLNAGLRSPNLALLDPALGTGVWLAAALERMTTAQPSKDRHGPQLLGFDVDDDALSQARTLLSEAAAHADAPLSLTHANMLTVADPFGPALQDHVRVIVGNPPWAARSRSRGLALSDAWLAEFRSDANGVSLGERRSGVLSDDYVRFFRWALEQVRESRAGAVLCLATNSSYLDGPVHRGMRAALLKAFDEIDILDLGGNALRGGDGARDENVFGVRVGTCVMLAVRKPGQAERNAPITYTKLTGTSAHKLKSLSQVATEPSTRFISQAPSFRFLPAKETKSSQTHTFSLAEALPFHREGVQTNRDAFVTDTDRARLIARLHDFADGKVALHAAPQLGDAATRALLQKSLENDAQGLIRDLAYRPLDQRYCFSLAPFCHRPRPDLFRAVEHSSLCLLSARKDRGEGAWNLFAVARTSADGCYLSTRSSCRTRVFPTHNPTAAENLDPHFQDALSTRVSHAVTSEQLIAYAIGMLASASFRGDHDALLHEDYPRIPWPEDASMFQRHLEAGEAWVSAWLSPDPLRPDALARGQHVVTYDLESTLLKWGDYTLEIAPELWYFSIGDFPVLTRISRRCVSWDEVFAAIQRVSACVAASAQAERAYQLSRPVR